MARIKKFDLPITDLFEDQAIGMHELGASIPSIPPREYRKIVLAAEKAFGAPLKKVTVELLNELIHLANEIYELKTSLVARKSLTVTVIVNAIEDRDVSVILRFDDLTAAGEIKHEIFKEMARQARFGKSIEVKNGVLIGYLRMPEKIYVLPTLVVNNDGNRWRKHTNNVNAERRVLRAKPRSLP